MTQPNSDQREWINWGGGERPVGSDTLVRIRRRSGQEVTRPAGNVDWSNELIMTDGGFNDIIAYRVVTP